MQALLFTIYAQGKDGKVQQWALDLKTKGVLTVGAASPKADIVIAVSDADFVNLASGKLNGQKAFMTYVDFTRLLIRILFSGKIKIKGNMMLATKLDSVLKELAPKAKL